MVGVGARPYSSSAIAGLVVAGCQVPALVWCSRSAGLGRR